MGFSRILNQKKLHRINFFIDKKEVVLIYFSDIIFIF